MPFAASDLCALLCPALRWSLLAAPLRTGSSSSFVFIGFSSDLRFFLVAEVVVEPSPLIIGKAEIDLFFVAAANVVEVFFFGSIFGLIVLVEGLLLDLFHIALGAGPLDA